MRVIFVSCVPRSGSTWLTNVVRDLYRSVGENVLPGVHNGNDDVEMREALETLDTQNNVYVFHTHSLLMDLTDFPEAAIITTLRDIRECLFSYCKFTGNHINECVPKAEIWQGINRHYREISCKKAIVRYSTITERPVQGVVGLAKFLGLDVPLSTAEAIAGKYSRENVKQLTDSLTRHTGHRIDAPKFMIQDKGTGFSTDHISNRLSWRDALVEEDQAKLTEIFRDWLMEFGFEI